MVLGIFDYELNVNLPTRRLRRFVWIPSRFSRPSAATYFVFDKAQGWSTMLSVGELIERMREDCHFINFPRSLNQVLDLMRSYWGAAGLSISYWEAVCFSLSILRTRVWEGIPLRVFGDQRAVIINCGERQRLPLTLLRLENRHWCGRYNIFFLD